MNNLPTCIITGRVVGDVYACGDCDPCILGEHAVPDAAKRLLAERDSFAAMHERASLEADRLRTVIRETAAYARALGRDYGESFAGGSSIENALAQVAERLEKEAGE